MIDITFSFIFLCYLGHENNYFTHQTESDDHETLHTSYTDHNDDNMSF